MKKLKRQTGFGLLELMLSMVIVALLLIMATRYYQSARNNANVNQAVDLINALNNAASNIAIGNNGSLANITITSLTPYLPNNSATDPWGGTIAVTSSSAASLVVTLPGASSSCTQVMDALGSSTPAGVYDTYACNTSTGLAITITTAPTSGSKP